MYWRFPASYISVYSLFVTETSLLHLKRMNVTKHHKKKKHSSSTFHDILSTHWWILRVERARVQWFDAQGGFDRSRAEFSVNCLSYCTVYSSCPRVWFSTDTQNVQIRFILALRFWKTLRNDRGIQTLTHRVCEQKKNIQEYSVLLSATLHTPKPCQTVTTSCGTKA